MTFRHPAERGESGRGLFEHLAERASNFTSSPLFSVLCFLLVAAFVATHVAGLSLSSQLFAGELMTAVTLLLLALLKNSERRAEHAIQRKLDAIAAALLEQHSGESGRSTDALKKAIRLEDES
ncbi:low affinity iron permease family protein [Streptomyces sp. NPDC048416]|uniref:low affinity iron permease family protein n=1 Tax=Streptomyces sp. NPDC048416 TaxID=3365546 RepID=UPI00370FB14D